MPTTKMPVQGTTEFELRNGGYVGVVTLRGAALRSLRYEGEVSVEGCDFDFRNEKVLGPIKIDHAFTGIGTDTHGTARVCLFEPSGTGVELAWGREWPWVQIHTGDKPVGPDRLGVAVEPMTCPPDAFNSGVDLIHLALGQVHSGNWSIRALHR
jgi:aldose 1-epimerase